eukprot:TRINITY_DN54602_c0_g1_i1.p1 TRINITY_DN54602_c0_g1~~TRINITY_DN54602_c0_g1_i1.p1  ORF type:complete len:960 (-),score=231.81 TRINITY_DN54602_c0_g1_i1:117-2912(-)
MDHSSSGGALHRDVSGGSQTKTKREKCCNKWSRCIVDNKYFTIFTTLLTIFALTGDDVRRMTTSAEADPAYNVLVLVSLVVFTLELLLSCFGKDDYWLGFFFWLDFVSTATIVMDLTWINDAMTAESEAEGEDGSSMKSGKTARMGAKSSRVVRVVRLVRLLKLYKAVYEARLRRKAKEERIKRGEIEEEDWDDDDDDLQLEASLKDQEGGGNNESQVGKKLSDKTTRRVICLILSMMLVLPFISQMDPPITSAEYGADHVMATFLDYRAGNATKEEYERAMVQYVYFHNWFAATDELCARLGIECNDEFYAHIFWVGLQGSDETEVKALADQAQLSSAAVSALNTEAQTQNDFYNYGAMPAQAQTILASKWNVDCSASSKFYFGLSLINFDSALVGQRISCPEQLRQAEYKKYTSRGVLSQEEMKRWNFVFFFDLRAYVKEDAMYSLCVTFFIMLLLVFGFIVFSSDANHLVVNPVEKMMKRVEAIRENPLIAIKMADEEFKLEEVAKARISRQGKGSCVRIVARKILSCVTCQWGSKSLPTETVLLEKTIIKLGSLLALGFGEAGTNIVAHNMSGSDSAGVNAMVPGTRVECIIGVARVCDFSIATEVLQANIMTFVNQIAEIVHGVVTAFNGAPNKNNGDAFLVIWRVGSDKKGIVDDEKVKTTRLADMSVMAFASVLGSIHQSVQLAEYRTHPGLQFRLGPRCRVNMTFGLHFGWAIEGAVGSEFKIDASYLSPNVSIANGIERCTQIYGVPLIISQSVTERCSPSLVRECRLIDRVIITGSPVPLELYCLDLDYEGVDVESDEKLKITWNTRSRFKARQFLENEKMLRWADDFDPAVLLSRDACLMAMRKRYTVQFFQFFNMGFQNYLLGEWRVARRMLSSSRAILGVEDGPSSAILQYMEEPHAFEVPKDWQGVREISSKELMAN